MSAKLFNFPYLRIVGTTVLTTNAYEYIHAELTGAANLTLPALSSTLIGQPLLINNTNSGFILTILAAGTDVIDGAASFSLLPGNSVFIVADYPNGNWHISFDTSGGNGISGPASSTNTAIVRWNGVGGNAVLNSGVTIDGSNNIVGPGTMQLDLQNTRYRFQEGSADAFGRRQLLFNASNSSDPADLAGLYTGNGGILRLGYLTADGDPENIISEGIVCYGQNSTGAPMTAANYSFSRMKPMRFAITDTVASVQTEMFKVDTSIMHWRPDSAAVDTVSFTSANELLNGNLQLNTVGNGIQIKEGANARMGTVALVGGTATVANTSVTATSRIYLTSQADGGAPGWLRVSSRIAGTSFTITSSSGTDTSTVAWLMVEAL